MTTILVAVAIAVALIAVVIKLTGVLSRSRAPTRTSLLLAIACLALAMTSRLPHVGAAINTAAGFSVLWPVNALLLIAAMYFFQLFFLYSVHGNDLKRVNGRYLWRLLTVLTCCVGILVPFVLRPAATDFVFGPTGRYEVGGPGDHLAQPSRILFAFYMGLAALTLTRLGIRWARKSGRSALQVGLGAFAIGSALGSVVAIHSAGYSLAILVGSVPPWAEATVAASLIPLACTLQVTGVVIPVLWPRLVRFHRWFAYRQALIALYPLWVKMCTAAPDIVLDPIQTKWQDRLRVRELDYLLYRRIIEIWDARRLLRQHLAAKVKQEAQAAGQRRGLGGDQLAAAVEAASIDAALHALRDGRPPEPAAAVRGTPESGDLATEVAWWRAVAVEYRQLPAAPAAR